MHNIVNIEKIMTNNKTWAKLDINFESKSMLDNVFKFVQSWLSLTQLMWPIHSNDLTTIYFEYQNTK